MQAKDIMTHGVCIINAEDSIRDAQDLMNSLQIKALPVVDHDKQLVGILEARSAQSVDAKAAQVSQVKDLMKPRPKTCQINTPVQQLSSAITTSAAQHLIVLNPVDKIVGIISPPDLLKVQLKN